MNYTLKFAFDFAEGITAEEADRIMGNFIKDITATGAVHRVRPVVEVQPSIWAESADFLAHKTEDNGKL